MVRCTERMAHVGIAWVRRQTLLGLLGKRDQGEEVLRLFLRPDLGKDMVLFVGFRTGFYVARWHVPWYSVDLGIASVDQGLRSWSTLHDMQQRIHVGFGML